MYIPKTPMLGHQGEFFELFKDAEFCANLSEQGTGKTKTMIDIAGYRYEKGDLDAFCVAAPNEGDIPENWLDQIGIHLPDRIKRRTIRLQSGYQRVADVATFKLWRKEKPQPGFMQIIATNIEMLRAGPAFRQLLEWFRIARVFFVIDEATRIASPGASQTRGALKLGMNTVMRGISTGTLTAGGPFNAYSPMRFLDESILEQPSFTAFKVEYCQMHPPGSHLFRHVVNKAAKSEEHKKRLEQMIQIPMRDANGRPIYKNLDALHKIIAKHSYRKLKSECLDLPPKVYSTRYVDFTPKQKEIYEQVRTEVIAEFIHDKRIVQMTLDMAIKRLLRLQQVIGNHYSPDPDPDEPRQPPKQIEPSDKNPKIAALDEIIEEASPNARGIIWCRFTPEIREIVAHLRAKHGADKVVEYHGEMSKAQQVVARKSFQDLNSPVRWLVGQIRAGIGVDMYAAEWAAYFSNDYSLENRLQSEDRAHRFGLKGKLTIFDIQTRNSIDSKIIFTLRSKKEVSEMILGDPPQNWI